jgi:hypothetical protein
MKFCGLILILALLAVAPAVRALQAVPAPDSAAATGNPYLEITNRNIFALVPIPPVVVDTNPPVVGDPPPKITPNGIMSIFGRVQVLFKVAVPAKGKEPAHEDSFMMEVGERQNDITVLKIEQATDKAAATITFDNHGVRQELALAAAPKLTTPSAATGGGGSINPAAAATARGAGLNPAVAARLARAAGGAGGSAGATENPGTDLNNSANEGSSQIYNPAKHDSQATADPEVNAAKMALNYLETAKKDPAKAALFPLTEQDKKLLHEATDPPQ